MRGISPPQTELKILRIEDSKKEDFQKRLGTSSKGIRRLKINAEILDNRICNRVSLPYHPEDISLTYNYEQKHLG